MVLLLVDDLDGRIVAEIETEEDARYLLESWGTDAAIPDSFCLVELRSHHGAIIGTDSSVKVRPFPRD